MKHPRIEVNPEIMFGKPVIKDTRIPVERLLRKLAAQLTHEQILEQHPRLTLEDIYAAEAYAADIVGNEEIILAGEHADP